MTASVPDHQQYPSGTLRVEPHALPTLRAAFDEALNMLGPHLKSMVIGARIERDWIKDEHSIGLREFYNERVMRADDGPFSALQKYMQLLHDVRSQLAVAEAEYRRVEGENSDLWGRA